MAKNINKKINKKTLIILFILIILIVAGLIAVNYIFSNKQQKQGLSAQTGDGVIVKYIAYIGPKDNLKVIDTNIEKVANVANLSVASTEPLKFILGSGTLIQGFEMSIVGMTPGQVRRVGINPEFAYGQYDEKKIIEYPKEKIIDKVIKLQKKAVIPIEEFKQVFGKNPLLNDKIKNGDVTWGFIVENITAEEVILNADVKVGELYQIPGTFWNSTIIKIEPTELVFEQNPKEGLIESKNSKWKIINTKDKIYLTSITEIGEQVLTNSGAGKVINLSNSTIKVDFNHPLAGQVVTFDIYLINITK